MHSDDVVISVRNVSKVYRLFDHPGDRVKQFVTFGMKKYHREFTALRDISFEVRRGEAVGVIGRNGAGKSTLLQIICGILKPTQGSVAVRGRIAALLELGAGFNPEFTGRENVYFQGSLMGISKAEMDERFGEIAAFAEIGEFIDQPVRVYSSGMFVRLAFAAAVHVSPDILVVDEALAVGDMEFRQKCLDRIEQLRETGATVLLVSHDIMLTTGLADLLIYLDEGRIRLAGECQEVSDTYIREAVRNSWLPENAGSEGKQPAPSQVRDVRVSLEDGLLRVLVSATLATDVQRPEIVVQFRDARGYVLYGRHAREGDLSLSPAGHDGKDAWAMLEVNAAFLTGEYTVSVSLNDLGATGTPVILDKRMNIATFGVPVTERNVFHGSVDLGGKWVTQPVAAMRSLQDRFQ